MSDPMPSMEEYLAGEVESQERGFRVSVVLYVVLAAFVVGYFQWLHAFADEILNEEALATLVVDVGEQTFQSNEADIKAAFKETVPRMTRDALRTAVVSTLPSLRRTGEELFAQYAREIAGAGSRAATEAFEVIVRDHKVELESLSGAPPGQYTHRPPALTHLDALIEREAGKSLNTRPEETVRAKLEASTRALKNIQKRLDALARSETGSRKDVLTRRLLSTWWTMIQTGSPESVVDQAMGLRPVERSSLEGFTQPE